MNSKKLSRIFFLVQLFCFMGTSIAQVKDSIMVEGTIRSDKDQTTIPGIQVVVKTDAGSMFVCVSDTSGNYRFVFRKPDFKKAEISIYTTKSNKTPTALMGFLATDDRGKITLDSTAVIVRYVKDFLLTPISCGPSFQNILFQKNSTEMAMYTGPYDYGDSLSFVPENIISSLASILKDNSSIVIELSAHCSIDETLPDTLSQQRAGKVKAELIKLGINEKRLVAKGYGIKKLKISTEQIKKVKTKQGKETLNAVNRRCVFKILSWDFEEPKK